MVSSAHVRRLLLLLLSLAAVVAGPAVEAASALDARTVKGRITRNLRSAGPLSGAYAKALDSGRTIIAVRSTQTRIPASVEKLFVTAAALLRWGPDHALATRVVSTNQLDEDGVVEGDVWLVGGGDPTLSDADLRRLAAAVRRAGLKRVEGALRVDDTRFDRRRGTPRTGFAPDGDLGGRLGALLVGRGFQADPAGHAGARLFSMLKEKGVRFGKRPRKGRAPADEEETLEEIATLASPPIRDLIRATNVPSDNFYAEMLLKELGAAFDAGGTTGAGAAVVRRTLGDFGIRPRIVDGSGLSRANRTSPRMVVRLLEEMERSEHAGTWRASMAVAGRSGTVSRRMRRSAAAGRCRVKTGTINGVSNLAGVCDTRGGPVAFAWLMNGVSPYGARRLQDRMTAAVAAYSGS